MSRTVSRNRRSAKKAGTALETKVCDYLRWGLDDPRIQRLRLHGAKDLGDIGNVYFQGQLVTIECKNTKRKAYAEHMREAETEAGNADSELWFVIQKLPGVGIATRESVGRQLVYTDRSVINRMASMLSSFEGDAYDMALRHRLIHLWRGFTVRGGATGSHPVSTTLENLALILNDFLPLGPGMTKGEDDGE
ncbi:hypothetical protein [Bifidobacterium apri]|uniref:Phage protein n=1 Tax=Bifidobacterium apri TaxID=1769423 RepID=A0A6A2V6G1_9BIFI|nr:hypothetical protein [Bifidobacterium apri]KAB8291523.1 hypothetical protein DSM100238_1840 [Bifidobacterium apri]